MTKVTAFADIAKLSFEDSLRELEEIVKRLEGGKSSLEDSISDYTRGTALKQHCEKQLEAARLKVEKLIPQSDGSLKTETFDHG
ncbi:MAG: exodeoxyribonuclease VII small subunit [Rickettsiales bacterium]|nr:exodeoxyribonuclease VII small subunit [Rickettsiales bacterium]